MHLIRSPATSNVSTETVAPSWRFDATSSTSDSVLSLVASHLISRPTRGAFSSRTVPIPVDTNKLTITCTKAPRPRVLNRDTGEIKTDKNGNTVYEVTVSVEDEFGRIELVKIGITQL